MHKELQVSVFPDQALEEKFKSLAKYMSPKSTHNKMGWRNGCVKKEDATVDVRAQPQMMTPGTKLMPFSVDCFSTEYKKSVLEKNPLAEDSDVVEAYLGYGPEGTFNYRCWNRMMEMKELMVMESQQDSAKIMERV